MDSYEIEFSVSREHSGKATYMAKQYQSYTSPYQVDCGNNRCKQHFVFKSLNDLLKFVTLAFKEFNSDFEVLGIRCRRKVSDVK